MMQSTENRQSDDLPGLGVFDGPRLRAILLDPEMSPALVVVRDVLVEDFAKVPSIEDNHVIEAIPPDGSDHPLHVAILPGAAMGGENLLDFMPVH